MKKITILLLAFMVPMLMQAQAKRRPAGAKAATTAKKPAQKATQKVNNNFAIVQFDEWMKHDVFEDENNIYFLGTTYGENTFRAIDKKTGDIRIVVPKKKRARPQICSAGSNGKDVFMRIENKKFVHIAAMGKNHVIGQTDNYEKKFYVWDNKDFTGQPTILKNIDTGIGQPDKWTGIVETKKIEGFTKVFTDSASNLWIQTGDGEFVIYNPDGIVGLTALKGKLTKNELPKEED